MARTDNLTNFLTDIATAIKDKKGDTTPIPASDFDTEITNLPSGGGETETGMVTFSDFNSAGFPQKATVNTLYLNGKIYERLLQGRTEGGSGAQHYFASISNIVVPKNTIGTGYCCFSNLRGLQTISFPEGFTTIDRNTFENSSALKTVGMPSTLTSIGERAFCGCSKLVLTSLPESVNTLGSNAFYGCTSLALTKLPDALTQIPSSCFYTCTALALSKLPDNITTISTSAFNSCYKVTFNEIPSGVNKIEDSAFRACTIITSMDIKSETLTTISSNSFYNCAKLEKLIIRSTSVPSLTHTNALGNTPIAKKTGYIYVVDDLVDTYKTTTNWSTYADQIKPISELEV